MINRGEFYLTSKNMSFFDSIPLEKDFAFIIGETRYECTKAQACFLSPKVQKLFKTDPTTSFFFIDAEDPKGLFGQFLEVLYGKPLRVDNEISNFAIMVGSKLGNSEIISTFSAVLFSGTLDFDNVIFRLKSKTTLNMDQSEEISFIASHFSDFPQQYIEEMGIDYLEMIIHSVNLVIDNEKTLLDFIIHLIETKGESYKILLSAVQYQFIPAEDMKRFLKVVNASDISDPLWSALKNRLKMDVFPDRETDNRHINKIGEIKVEFDDKDVKKGIIRQIYYKCGGDPCGKKQLTINSSSTAKNDDQIVILFENSDWWSSKDEPNQYLEIDFVDKRVIVTGYTLVACCSKFQCGHPKNWDIIGSNDGSIWSVIDRRRNDNSLNGNRISSFICPNKVQFTFKFVRIVMRGSNHIGNSRLILAAIELYGSIFYPTLSS